MDKRKNIGVREAMNAAMLRDQAKDQGGMLPPQAIELEQAVLGALMLEKTAFQRVSEYLQPQMFFREAHADIYQAICNLVKKGNAVDLLTVTHQLRVDEKLLVCGGALYISQLTNKVASTANIEAHAAIILQTFLKRELISLSMRLGKDGYDDSVDIFDLLDETQSNLIKLTNDYIPSGQKTIAQAIEQVGIEISQRADGGKQTGSVPSTMPCVNKQLGGYGNSDFVVIGARSGVGKTAFIISEALGMAIAGEPVGFFSLEMSTVQLTYRIASQVTGLDINTLTREQMDTDQVTRFYSYYDKIKALPIHFDDTPALKIEKLRAKAHKMKERYGIKILFIDYLQLIKSQGGNRENEVANVSKTLKQIAKELDIPIVCLSQLSREVEKRADKKPILSDLRESGSLEQDADIVGFLYRPSYYGFTQDEEGNPIEYDYAELNIAKFRNGQTGVIPLRYKGHLTMYSDPNVEWSRSVSDTIKRNDSFLTASKTTPF